MSLLLPKLCSASHCGISEARFTESCVEEIDSPWILCRELPYNFPFIHRSCNRPSFCVISKRLTFGKRNKRLQHRVAYVVNYYGSFQAFVISLF